MKKGLLLCLLSIIPFLGFGQQTSWFEVELEFGGWDTNPNAVCITQNGDTIFYKERLNGQTPRYHYAVINADTGTINVAFTSKQSAGRGGVCGDAPPFLNAW